ncbi:DUF6124 family protein [Pseudomonas citri]|uniref:DUF6124 family protein n=1 Tax=Pseudomonas citri TaxID=2978349 RepID=UPI0021B6B382|nr:DUF6124 family protein [Pseudomonas citri]
MNDKPASPSPTHDSSFYSNPSSKKHQEAAKRALDFHLSPPEPRPESDSSSSHIFTIVDGIDTERLLVNLSETLASANATLSDLAFELEGSRRHVALGVQQLIELSQLLANRVLDERVPVEG